MPFNPDTATANVIIDGLSISCFNRSTRMWEVGYLRHPLHNLRLQINDECDNVLILRQNQVIRIETTKGVKPDYDKTFPDGFFDLKQVADRRLDPTAFGVDQRRNFRWAVNLDLGQDIPHGEGTLKKPPYPVTIAQISDAVFYANRLPPDNLFLLPLTVDATALSTAALDQKVFGKAADEIGASITCEDGGGITITVDGEVVRQLAHNPEKPWTINLKNMPATHDHIHDHDHGGAHEMPPVTAGTPKLEQGDFQLYYDSVEVTGEKQTFWGVVPVTSSGRTDCNAGWVSKSSLADLFS